METNERKIQSDIQELSHTLAGGNVVIFSFVTQL